MRVTIQKNFYWSAGTKYGWVGKYETSGVGIAMDILKFNSEIEIEIGNRLYTLDCNQAISFIKTYKTQEKYREKSVGIVTKSLLRDVNPTKKVEVDNSPLQLKLL